MERQHRDENSTGCLPKWARTFLFELVKWMVIVGPIYLSVWRYWEKMGYTEFISGHDDIHVQCWGIFSAIMAGASIVYLVWRIIAVWQRQKYRCTRDVRWRPAIVTYIVLCAAPCFTLVFIAYHTTDSTALNPGTTTVLQIVILGLVVTEWMIKVEQEHFTFELLTSMAMDFFFAYDIIAFIMMSSYKEDIFTSNWVYAFFIFAVLAMFKYVPTHPTNYSVKKSGKQGIICIIGSLVFNDIPFAIIRFCTMIIFGFLISDLIFVLKNFSIIIFNVIQLVLIFHHRHESEAIRRKETKKKEWEKRAFRDIIIWHADKLKQNRIETENGHTNEAIEVQEIS